MKKLVTKRIVSLLLVFSLLAGFAVPVRATEPKGNITWEQVDNNAVTASPMTEVEEREETSRYADTDVVRVSIVLEKLSTMDKGFQMQGVGENLEAEAYRADLQAQQRAVTSAIERKTGETLDVVWNLTLAANLISANVPYGRIESIEAVPGVSQVLIETVYEPAVVNEDEPAVNPNMAPSSTQTGSSIAWSCGYTGAGMRIAVIDTGTDTDHQAFDAGAYNYSLAFQAGLSGKTLEAYLAGLDLLDAEEIASVAGQLNVSVDPQKAYFNTKLPFGYNYVDGNYDITHDNDEQGAHGSHVAGIVTANSYVPAEDGYVSTAVSTKVRGVAPDAQLITMKVFGKGGGAYDSDLMAAIEDAVVLGCDSVNLSMGSSSAGDSRAATAYYQKIMENLENSGVVVSISAGNAFSWAYYSEPNQHLYAEDINMDTVGSPGSFTNALTVASANNAGATGSLFLVQGEGIAYREPNKGSKAAPITSIPGEYEYIIINGTGTQEDWDAVKANGETLEGKILSCRRDGGSTSQSSANSANIMMAEGAVAGILYYYFSYVNAELNLPTSWYNYENPCVAISFPSSNRFKELSTPICDENGEILYYKGTLVIPEGLAVGLYKQDYSMSDFSSWGVPGSLELKPEITAPGGEIYSVDGAKKDGTSYVVMSGTSMAAPQVTGMAALVKQYIEENGLEEKTGLDARTLAQSLLMSTAVPMMEKSAEGLYYPVIRQGAGLGNVGYAVTADSYILMNEDATGSWADGKVKAELGDDPDRTGEYSFSFTINNLADSDKAFSLYADFFTQGTYQSEVDGQMATFMDYATENLPTDVTWKVNGTVLKPSDEIVGLDFNGDGSVNAADGETLLGYVVGTVSTIEKADKADLDNDGDIDTYDAYLFFKLLSTGATVVPASGSVTVEVTAKLSDDTKARLEEKFPNGTFVQGYVYAGNAAGEEDPVSTTHSIPVLAFYGNWTDASMFERGSYAQWGSENFVGELYTPNGMGNNLIVTYADRPDKMYYFNGNPVVLDPTYMPERNAINSENGDTITAMEMMPIRNASQSKLSAVNKTTGVSYIEKLQGSFQALYLVDYVLFLMWTSGYGLNVGFTPENAREGDQLEVNLTLVPEYYVDDEGNVDWDALGDGATFSTPMVVDNTAPVMTSMTLDVMNNTIVVKASDNHYVAGVGLYTRSGMRLLAAAGSKTDIQPGEEAEYVIDLSEVNGNEFLLQVCDYAMNRVTYRIETQIGDDYVAYPNPWDDDTVYVGMAYGRGEEHWMYLSDHDYSSEYWYIPDETAWRGGATAQRTNFITNDNGDLYAAPEEDFPELNFTFVRNLGRQIDDMAYNKADGKLYGTSEGELVTIDMHTGALQVVGKLPHGKENTALACDSEGTFYTSRAPELKVYSFTLDTLDAPQVAYDLEAAAWEIEDDYTALQVPYGLQTMEFDHNTQMLHWATFVLYEPEEDQFCANYQIDLETGEFIMYDYYMTQHVTSYLLQDRTEPDKWVWPEDVVTEVDIGQSNVSMLVGGSETLSGSVLPWSVSNRKLTWTSSDENVVKVNSKGVVTAVGAGTATVTATSVMDPSFSDTCVITVENLDVTLSGVLMDENGVATTFTWNTSGGNTWTRGTDVDTSISNAVYVESENVIYAQDGNSKMHKLDAVTGKTLATSSTCAMGGSMFDMTNMEGFKFANGPAFMAVAYHYVLGPSTPMVNDFDYGWYFLGEQRKETDSNCLVAITSTGTAENSEGETCEHMYMLDDKNNIWDLRYNGNGGLEYSIIPTDLGLDYPMNDSYQYNSMVHAADGSMYLSHFNGTTNEVYRLVYRAEEGKFRSANVGAFGDGLWPAVLTGAEANGSASGNAVAPNQIVWENARTIQGQHLTEEEIAGIMAGAEKTGKKHTEAQPESTITPIDADKTVTVDVTAKDATGADVASTNGLVNVKYDTTKLTLTDVSVNSDYSAQITADGSVIFGYVTLSEIAAGSTAATLTFRAKGDSKTEITVETIQVNNAAGGTETVTVEFEHINTEVRDAIEATCTTAGYTGDTWCLDCGQLVEKGKIMEALGHSYGEWTVSVEATCFTGGEEIRICEVCGETETRVIEKNTDSCPCKDFTDLDNTKWYHRGVDYVLRNGLMKGMGDGKFAPNATLTRAELVTALYRLAGEPSVEGLSNPFEDVPTGKWYSDAISWAANEGIIKGTSDTTFAPHRAITREEIAAIMFRFSEAESVEEDFLKNYGDAGKVSPYAEGAMNWAVATGLIRGMEDGTLAPKSDATRAQIATILMRYCETIN